MNELILGQRRQGKSTLSAAEAARVSETTVIFDPNENYRMPGMIRVTSPTHLKELFDNEELPKYSVLRIGPFDQEDLEPAFGVFSEVLWRYEDYALIVDESHMLQSKNRMNKALDRWLRRSPASVHIIQTAHRMLELNGLSRYLCDDLRLFRNEQPRELDLIEEQFGVPSEEIKTLGDRQHVHWYRDDAGNPKYFIQRDTECWYVDLKNPNRRRSTSESAAPEGAG